MSMDVLIILTKRYSERMTESLIWESVGINSIVVYRGISFINKDTSWVCGFDGEISK